MPTRPLPRAVAVVALIAAWLPLVPSVDAQPAQRLLDPSASPAWQTVASEGVALSIEHVPSDDGTMLRIEYSFESGAGFGIVRRPFVQSLGDNYRFRYRIRGSGPANDLEFKLVDDSGDNVWWVNRRAFVPTEDWTQHTNRRRHFEFAWGPSEGAPIEHTGWIEFAVASHDGGSGVLLIDRLEYEPLPPEVPYVGTPTVTDRLADAAPARTMGDDGTVDFMPTVRDGRAQFDISFGTERTLSAIVLEWDNAAAGSSFSYAVAPVGSQAQQPIGAVAASHGGTDLVWLGENDISGLRFDVVGSASEVPALRSVEFLEPGDVPSQNDLLRRMARQYPAHAMPSSFHDIQTAWTVSGVPEHAREAIISEHGRVEFDKGGASIEPFMIYSDSDTVGWDGALHEQSLVDGALPIPSVTRRDGVTDLTITAVSTGNAAESRCLVRYAVTNTSEAQLDASLVLAVRPLQVLPHWQRLNVIGGFSSVRSIEASEHALRLNARRPLFSLTPADAAEVWDLQDAPLPAATPGHAEASLHIEQSQGFAAGAWRYRLALEPGETATVLVEIPFADESGAFADTPTTRADGFAEALAEQRALWNEMVGRVPIRLPASAEHLEHTIRSTLAYLLINRDGVSLQPGSRTYERSWIRDGAISTAALLAFGHDQVVHDYLDWYAGFSFDSGKVPCVVDHRGPDPVDEHDSTGQLLFALARHARVTGDHSLLVRHSETIDNAVAYLEGLIAQRSTDAFAGTAYYGLVPESISHEGYSAKPMHSYWDCFFVLQGLRDAAWIAEVTGKPAEASRRAELAQVFASNLNASIRKAAREQSIGYIPGCVELGDFDPTSTAVALAPLRIADALPPELLATTLEMYTDFFESRRLGQREWFDYTPYELRVIGAMHTIGRHDEAHRMMDWFLAQQTPVGWNQWPEVVYADPKHPGFVGDIPHTWCATGLVNSFVTGLIHVTSDELLIGSGIPDSWYESPDGFSIDRLRTEFGSLSISSSRADDEVSIELMLSGEQPRPLTILVALPSDTAAIGTIRLNGVKVEALEGTDRMGRRYIRLPIGE